MRLVLFLQEAADLSCQLSEPPCEIVCVIGTDPEPSHGPAVFTVRVIQSVGWQFDIDAQEVAEGVSVVDIDIKASRIIHLIMMTHPGLRTSCQPPIERSCRIEDVGLLPVRDPWWGLVLAPIVICEIDVASAACPG